MSNSAAEAPKSAVAGIYIFPPVHMVCRHMSLQGKVAVITGASRGIGRAIALRLARDGACVVINFSNNAAPADELVEQIGNDRAIAIKADVSRVDEVKRLVKETVDKWGKIDILVNCAGVLPMDDLKSTSEEGFDKAFGVNVKGPYFLTQVVIGVYFHFRKR